MPVFLLPLLKWLSGLITGPLLQAGVDIWKQKLVNADSADQHTVDLAARELLVEQREAELNAQVQIADEGHFLTRMVRPAFAYPLAVYWAKTLLWDKALAFYTHGSTADLTPNQWTMAWIIVGFYFLHASATRLTSVLARKAS